VLAVALSIASWTWRLEGEGAKFQALDRPDQAIQTSNDQVLVYGSVEVLDQCRLGDGAVGYAIRGRMGSRSLIEVSVDVRLSPLSNRNYPPEAR
jgi:hypothetical protein